MRRASTRRTIGVLLILGGIGSVAIGITPILLPPAGKYSDRTAAALSQTWPTPSTIRQISNPPASARPRSGTAFAVLRVPRFGAAYARVIAEGLSASDVLNTGAIGHYPTSVMPGAIGNFAIAGHREAAGAPLLHLPDLRIGDEVIVDTRTARYVYRVTWRGIVAPDDIDAVAPNPFEPDAPSTRRLITLQTCTPPLIDTDRFIVHGELSSWSLR